jgi:hypothetical protein
MVGNNMTVNNGIARETCGTCVTLMFGRTAMTLGAGGIGKTPRTGGTDGTLRTGKIGKTGKTSQANLTRARHLRPVGH